MEIGATTNTTARNRSCGLILKWCYASGIWYEFSDDDIVIVSKLYHLKRFQHGVKQVELWRYGDSRPTLTYKKPAEDE
jgi:hypothetical protein